MSGNLPLVSIITPSYQQGRWLAQNLESIRLQSYPRIEHIVRDGGSTDETLEVLRSTAGDHRWTSEPDRGQTDALNKGIFEAAGEIVGWVNSDDYLFPTAVETAVRAILELQADAVYGECILVDIEGRAIGYYRTQPFSYAELLNHNIIAQPAVFFRRSLYQRFGPLDETLQYSMDYEYWLRCSRESVFRYVPELFAAYRIHGKGKTSSGSRANAAEANRIRLRYGEGVLPKAQLLAINLRTYLGGVAKSVPMGVELVRRFKWQRTRNTVKGH